MKTRNEDKKQVNLYGISTLSELAQALKIPEENLIEETQKGYRSYFVQGKTKKRLIEEPNMILKDILKDLKKLLVKMFDCPEYNKCWLGGNNYITHKLTLDNMHMLQPIFQAFLLIQRLVMFGDFLKTNLISQEKLWRYWCRCVHLEDISQRVHPPVVFLRF